MKSPLRVGGIAAIAAAIVLVAPAMTASAASLDNGPGVSPQSQCSPGWYYANTSRGADTFSKVGSTHSDYNGTPTPATVTFTATTSGTLTASASGSLNVGLSVKVASIASTYGISASTSLTVTTGNAITITVPSHKTGNGDYGGWRAYVAGVERYYNAACTVTQTRSTVTHAPYKKGWNVWIS